MATTIVNNFINTWDEDARNYLLAVEQADGELLERDVWVAVNAFVVGCKNKNIWGAIKSSCILAGARTLNGALVPLVGDPPTNFGFSEADYDRKTGLKGGESSYKYLDSNRLNSAEPQNDRHVTVWADTNHNVQFLITTPSWNIHGDTYIYLQFGLTNFRLSSGVPGPPPSGEYEGGFYGISRSNGANIQYRFNGASGIKEESSGIPLEQSLIVFGSPESHRYRGRIKFYSIGGSLDLEVLESLLDSLWTRLVESIP